MSIYRYAPELWKQAEEFPETKEQLACFHRKLDGCFPAGLPQEERRICIFCVGEYGESLYWKLRERLVMVNFFSDNDAEKWGYVVDRVSCLPPDRLKRYGDRLLIIVANQSPKDIAADLRNKGYQNIITKQELDPLLQCTPPVKWVSKWQNTDLIDYSTPEAEDLVRQFSQTIFELCAYYQARLERSEHLNCDE